MQEAQQRVLDTQKMVWSLGEYSRIALFLRPIAQDLLATCAIGPGQTFLDVGAGTGNLAIEAAQLEAKVVAVDPTTHLLEVGRERTSSAGLEVEWHEADAQNLPFDDNSFDAVGSVMASMFAPDADAAVREMVRVVKPGGAVAMTAWARDGYIGHALALTARYMPPPPEGVNTSGEWADPDTARSRFERHCDDVSVRERSTKWEFASEEDARRFFEDEAPPSVAAKMALPPDRYEQLQTETAELQARFSEGTDEILIESKYLMIAGRKPT